ncbi:hypothetical protein N7486_008717 [Penicillium sp. IBT 16267x]|nr:hypothetical protein N7486_008717 [Penicillium sp. IBT 16267x]
MSGPTANDAMMEEEADRLLLGADNTAEYFIRSAANVMVTLDHNVTSRGEVRLNTVPFQCTKIIEDKSFLGFARFLADEIQLKGDEEVKRWGWHHFADRHRHDHSQAFFCLIKRYLKNKGLIPMETKLMQQ